MTVIISVITLSGGAALGTALASSRGGSGASTCSSTTTTSTSGTTSTGQPPPIPQPQGHPLNNNTVQNCQDGTIKASSKLQTASAGGNDANPVNYAYAYAHDCPTGCEAIAAAFQVVLVNQGASTQTPENVAQAINYNCNGCGVFAYAYQYAVDVPKGAHLSPAAEEKIADIRRQADADVKANLSFSALDAKLRDLAAQLQSTVDQDLQNHNIRETDRDPRQHVKESGTGPS
jgi:putative peptide zinc metalloprotease protein